MDFNEKIKERGLKKTWVAEQIGISNVLLSFYLTKTRPRPEKVKRALEEFLA